ncbi:hypothetical protein OH77DRAFT_1517471 [Trametes cingulata]|nr:hypothetical protein OH77DRAFT_1517471 [Trametes cingulata]
MKSLSASLVSVALLVAAVSAQFQINTPNPPTQCVPVQITWSGGNPPYFLQYPNLQGTSFTWQTNISAGQEVGFTLTDSSGSVAQSAPVIIQSGPITSCLNGQSSGSSAAGESTTSAASGASTTATSPAATGTSAATTGGSSAGGSTSSHTGTSTGTSASSSPSATGGAGTNGALSNVASMGVVGVLGAVAAALLA